MNCEQDLDISQLETELQTISTNVRVVAHKCEGNSRDLLSLLRTLELLHREIREEKFNISLPETRNDLYQLLKEIEETGGWPYIERMKLQTLLVNLLEVDSSSSEGEQLENQPPQS